MEYARIVLSIGHALLALPFVLAYPATNTWEALLFVSAGASCAVLLVQLLIFGEYRTIDMSYLPGWARVARTLLFAGVAASMLAAWYIALDAEQLAQAPSSACRLVSVCILAATVCAIADVIVTAISAQMVAPECGFLAPQPPDTLFIWERFWKPFVIGSFVPAVAITAVDASRTQPTIFHGVLLVFIAAIPFASIAAAYCSHALTRVRFT